MKMTTEIFIERAQKIHGNVYDYSQVVYTGVKSKVKIGCRIHGVFEQTPDKHLHGPCGCPKCAGNQHGTTDDFVEKAKRVHGDTYDYSQVSYVNSSTPVEIVCKKHGSFRQSPGNHLSGKGCPVCANNMRLSSEAFIKRAKCVHGDRYGYSLVEYHGNRVPVKIVCETHGVFEQIPYVHLTGCGCPACGRIEQAAHRDEAAIHAKAEETFRRKYGVSNPMFDPGVRARHKKIVSSDELNEKRSRTKREHGSYNTSLPEYRLGVLLRDVFGDDDVVSNYKSDAYPFHVDFYIPSRDLYIELNAHWSHGGHWYSDCDAEIVANWMAGSKYHQNSAVTFSVRDVRKRECARISKLNYVVFWESDLSDAKKWIDMGCPDGQDWIKEYSWLS